MNLKTTRLHILHKEQDLSPKAKTGVSLHCHTQHSKEMLDFVPHYAEKLPVINYFWRRERDNYVKRKGKKLDFSTAFWLPPFSEKQVYDIEKEQINNAGLDALVSLTDHDSIKANLKLCESEGTQKAPISLEWTIPFEYGFFHVGVHNLPKAGAVEIAKTLVDYTFDTESRDSKNLGEMLDMLNEIPGVLIVLNHPLWDIEMVGRERHEILLKSFIKEHGRRIHAFEINGYRKWSENKAVIEMAEALNIPVVTGGDRHGCQPNTVINLSNAATFEEFVEEIRVDKRSEIVLMPEYKQPIHSRQLQSFSEILKNYPEHPEGWQRWFDRIRCDVGDGRGIRPLSDYWKRGGPTWLRWAIWTLGVMGSPRLRPAFRVFVKRGDIVPKDLNKTSFEIPNLDDITTSLTPESSQGAT
jgi:hypothetical protein